ncbi:MAG: hypothetical protein ABIQ90_11925 [Polaromonas sp.]
MSNPVSQMVRFILKLVLGLSALLIAVSLLVVAVIVFSLSLLQALFTGRKPAPAVVFGRFQQFSQQDMWPGSRAREAAPKIGAGQVVDVEVREIPEARNQH